MTTLLKYKKDYLEYPKRKNLSIQEATFAIEEDPSNIVFAKDFSEDLALNALHLDGMLLPLFPKQTKQMCLVATRQNYKALDFVDDQTDEVCIEALKSNWKSIYHIRNQNKKICDEAIRVSPLVYPELLAPTKHHQMEVVRADSSLIELIPNPSKEACLYSVKDNGLNLKLIKAKYQDKEICLEAIRQNPDALKYARKQTEEMILWSVSRNGLMLPYAQKHNEKIVWEAMKNNPQAYKYRRFSNKKIDVEAIELDAENIKYVEKQTEDLAKRAVDLNYNVLPYINEDLFEEKKGIFSIFGKNKV